jgi:hypothetical protein
MQKPQKIRCRVPLISNYLRRRKGAAVELWRDGGEAAWAGHQAAMQQGQSLLSRFLLVVTKVGRFLLVSRQAPWHCFIVVPACQATWLAERYDNPMPELTLFPSKGL